MISQEQYVSAAKFIGCDVAAVKAVDSVESGGAGFNKKGDLIILFEPHIFYKELKKVGIDPERYRKTNLGLLNPVWDSSLYKVGGTSWDKLRKAITIHPEAAYKSASYGRYQILGQNHRMIGYASAKQMVDDFKLGEHIHLEKFVKYIKVASLDDELRLLDWKGFARGYNGPMYWKNAYDTKLARAYKKFKA